MEAVDRGREAAVHRRGKEAARDAHEGASGLQVQAAEEAQGHTPRGLSVPDAISFCSS